MLEARRLALPALESLGDWLLDDVCVPRSRIAELISAVEQIAASVGLTIGVFGHAGDGNFHPTVVFDAKDPTARPPLVRPLSPSRAPRWTWQGRSPASTASAC